jgi:hypothetical protein
VTEQEVIYETWLRVAEDYAPFDVDVTTEQPEAWTRTTAHALITPPTDANGVACPHDGAGGVAYDNIFGTVSYSYNFKRTSYSPAWVNTKDASGQNLYAADIAEIVYHELGHNMGLHHDGLENTSGVKTDGYYDGHQNGSVSWGAIMGTSYGRNVSQWCKGDYYLANNPEDDLAIIAGKLSYLPDDCGDSAASATLLTLDDHGAASVKGMTEQTDDPDVFRLNVPFALGVNATIRVAQLASDTWGANLDVLFEIRDSLNNVVASNNEELVLSAEIYTELLPGTYFLYVIPAGVGDPFANLPTGYTSYGSLGQYEILMSSVLIDDIDRDGLPNEWEERYFDGQTNASPAATASNGINTLIETYIAGINPIDPEAFFTTYLTNESGFVVQWNGASGRVYSVWGTTNLTGGFLPLETNILWPQNRWTDTVDRAGGYYRVDVELE